MIYIGLYFDVSSCGVLNLVLGLYAGYAIPHPTLHLGLAVFIAPGRVHVYILVTDSYVKCTYSFKTSDGEQKLRDAAERGDICEVARLIESGVSVNSNCVVSMDCTFTCMLYKSYIPS